MRTHETGGTVILLSLPLLFVTSTQLIDTFLSNDARWCGILSGIGMLGISMLTCAIDTRLQSVCLSVCDTVILCQIGCT